jgi:N-acetylneuraminic acid mutarotase
MNNMLKSLPKLVLLFLLVGVVPVAAQDEPVQSAWSVGADMPTRRSELASALLDGRIYAAGGIGENWTIRNEVERYDPATNTWETVAPLPVGLHHFGMAAVGGRVYVTGGYADMNFTADQTATYAYDPATNIWTTVAPMPSPRAAHTMVAIDGKLHVVGGVGTNAEKLLIYDPASDTWDDSAPPLPTTREHLAAVAMDENYLYVLGGRTDQNLSIVEAYSPGERAWITNPLPEMITPRGGITSGVIDGVIHVTGGEDLSSEVTYRQHEGFNLLAGVWETLEPLPTARHGLTSVTHEGRWYVIGGATGAGNQTAETATGLVEIFTVRAPHPDSARTGFPTVDAVIEAVLSSNPALQNYIHYTRYACVTVREFLDSPPACRAGEAEGAEVEALLVLFSEATYVRRDEIDLLLAPADYNLYAVFRVSSEPAQAAALLDGEYGVVFVDEGQDFFNVVTMRVNSEGIVRIDYGTWPNALFGRGIGEFVLAPVIPVQPIA